MIDYLNDSDGDLRIENGDFVTGPSNEQSMSNLLVLQKGELRQFP
jgi:hypothetical protein